ncbi:MAG: class I SAM-dependent methyltransferase [Actinomycetota bacterium]
MSSDERKLGLDDAYAVETPDDNRALYKDWASTYEADFIEPRGYIYHEEVVRLFVDVVGTTGPVLDVGCGTGIVGEALASQGVEIIDGIDISPEMLAEASGKGCYRDLSEVDVTQPLDIADGAYGGVTSVGTFTHGHLGPEPLHELVRVVAPGGVLAIGINAEHYEEMGFEATLTALEDSGAIEPRRLERVRIYSNADDEHADDLALVALLTRAH